MEHARTGLLESMELGRNRNQGMFMWRLFLPAVITIYDVPFQLVQRQEMARRRHLQHWPYNITSPMTVHSRQLTRNYSSVCSLLVSVI